MARTSAKSTSEPLEVVKLSASSTESQIFTGDTHRRKASKQADVQRRSSLENYSPFNFESKPARSPRVHRASTAPSVFAEPEQDLAVKKNEKETIVMQNICWQNVLMLVAVLVWRQEIYRTT